MRSRRHSPENWAEIERLFAGALERGPAERDEWLAGETDDPRIRAEVLRLVRSLGTAGGFLARLDTAGAAELVRATSGAGEEALEALEAVGPYRVIRLLARGGMGVVYLARDERLGRRVALKCLPRRLETEPGMRERFLAEARAASALDHPHIATVHDVGETPDGGLFIAMAYYEGRTLADLVAGEPLEVPRALRLAGQVAAGLAAAHSRGIVHRDVKPANVLVTTDDQAKILDFGIAKTTEGQTTRAGLRLGTVAYMSPEQTRGDAVDARSDVWSFGVLLYEMLAGRHPFARTDESLVVHAIRHDDPPPVRRSRPGVPEPVATFVHRCLSKDPSDRPADGRRLAAELGRLTGGAPRRSRRPAALAAVVATVLGLAALAAFVSLRPPRPGSGDSAGLAASAPAPDLDPDLVLVLPFSTAGGDSVLERLGLDLGVTLSTSLDGLGELRTVDGTTVAARAGAGAGEPGAKSTLGRGLQLARELGAGRLVHGSLLWSASGGGRAPLVRSDLAVYRTVDGSPELRTTASAEARNIGLVSDSITWALLRALWPSDDAPAVEPHALSAASLPALRAYLEGEVATAEGRWRDAPDSFARAFAVDSTFWLAYARYVQAMSYRSRPVAPEIRQTLVAHLADLPELDRALIEAGRADGLADRLERERALVDRFPHSWRAWFSLADVLIHHGFYAGTTLDEARAAIERATALHPNSATHWQHVFWMALAQDDTAATAVALDELERLDYDSATMREVGLDELRYYRYLHGLAAGGDGSDSASTAWRRAAADSMAAQLVRYVGPLDLEKLGGSVSIYGSHPGEIALAAATLRRATGSAAAAGALRGLAQAWAGRGAWDSAMAVLDEYTQRVRGVEPLQHALRLAVVGQWLGALEVGAGDVWRTALERASHRLDPAARAELAWLDGVAAVGRSDAGALAAARRRLSAPSAAGGGGVVASLLDRSLAAFQLALDGDTASAAEAMLALEDLRTEEYLFLELGDRHPYLTSVNRLAGADWLLSVGRPAEAARLLRWHEAVQFPAHLAPRADATFDGIIEYRRAMAEDALGNPERARRHFLKAAGVLDRPVAALRPLVDSARATLER